jgi:hypothetical protein
MPGYDIYSLIMHCARYKPICCVMELQIHCQEHHSYNKMQALRGVMELEMNGREHHTQCKVQTLRGVMELHIHCREHYSS